MAAHFVYGIQSHIAIMAQAFHCVTGHEKKDLLLTILQDTNRKLQEKTLIVLKTKRKADFIALLVNFHLLKFIASFP